MDNLRDLLGIKVKNSCRMKGMDEMISECSALEHTLGDEPVPSMRYQLLVTSAI